MVAGPSDQALDRRLGALLSGQPEALGESHAIYRDVREHSRTYEYEEIVLVTHHADVKSVVHESTQFSNLALVAGDRIDDARRKMAPNERDAFDAVTAFFANFPSRADGQHHTRLRSAASRAFTPGKIAAIEASIRQTLDWLLGDLRAAGPVDFVDKVAFRLPLLVVADLLDVPRDDIDDIHRWSTALGASTGATVGAPFLAAKDALDEFQDYVDRMIERSVDQPSTDLVSLFLGAELDQEELAALFVQILFAGHETTTTLLSAGLYELLRAPDRWRDLANEPALAATAVEETVRLVSPAQFVSRLACSDTQLGETHINEGTTILAVIAAANRDPQVFTNPDEVDFTRTNLADQLAFGFGSHFCLGSALARLEARVVYEELSQRFPDASLATEDLRWSGGAMLRRLTQLPIMLGPPSATAANSRSPS